MVAPRDRKENLLDRFVKLKTPRLLGSTGEDPYDFFLELEHCFKARGIIDDASRVRLTAFLLIGRATRW